MLCCECAARTHAQLRDAAPNRSDVRHQRALDVAHLTRHFGLVAPLGTPRALEAHRSAIAQLATGGELGWGMGAITTKNAGATQPNFRDRSCSMRVTQRKNSTQLSWSRRHAAGVAALLVVAGVAAACSSTDASKLVRPSDAADASWTSSYAPSAPQNVVAAAGNASATISWAAPASS